jgi:hypothetical protein
MAEDMTWMPAALPPPDHPAYDFLSFRSSGLNPVDPTTGTSTPTPASQPKPTTGLQEV